MARNPRPPVKFSDDYLTAIAAMFGTTISPYLIFWQAGEEVVEEKDDPAAKPLIAARGRRRGRRLRCS